MKRARELVAGLLGAGIATVVALFSFTPVGTGFEERIGLPWLFRVRGTVDPPPEIVIVALNKQSAVSLALPADTRTWPRSLHAQLIHNLVDARASVIVFDVAFKEFRSKEEDDQLAAAIASARRVLLYEWREQLRRPAIDPGGVVGGSDVLAEVSSPLTTFAKAAAGVAPFPIPRTPARVSQAWAFHGGNSDTYTPTLAAVALQLYGREAYETWIELLKEARFPIGASSMAGWPDVNSKERIDELARDLRTSFTHNPVLISKLRQELEKRGSGTAHQTKHPDYQLAALLRLYEGPDSFYLNFYGPPGTIPTIPYHALVGRGASVGDFDLAGKVVFVGYSELLEPSKEDGYDTVFTRSDGVQLSGVEIIATAFANLLTGNRVNPLGPLIAGPIVFALGMTVLVGAYFLPPALGLVLAFGLGALHAIAAQLLFNWHGIWMPLATPLLIQMPLVLGLGVHAQSVLARRRYKQMQRAVRYYVPPGAAHELIDNRADPIAMSRTVDAACLTAIAENLTAVVEGMMPHAAAAYLNAYFEALAEPFERYRPDVAEFRNDGALCAWTCPQLDEAMRLRACLAALETLDAVDGFNGRNAPLHLDVRLGMHAGQAYIGHAGAGGHLRYGVVGDIATTTDHIGHLNAEVGTRLLAAEPVVAGLKDLLVRPLGEFYFPGKQSPVPIVEIISATEGATMTQISLCGRFATAMKAFREECWAEANARFEAILKDYPNDAPSRFYLRRCANLSDRTAS